MLGSDPVSQYDFGLDPSVGAPPTQGVITLEPVYSGPNGGGGEPDWVDWYLRENFSGNCLSFAYTQAGQENSFGWPAMRRGLEMQFARFAKLSDQGRIQIETLGESGRWFRRTFRETPASTVAALSDWKDRERRSVWYNCKNYRVNLYADPHGIRIRDLYLFREDYPERYLNAACRTPCLKYDNLPVVDGNRFSGQGILSGFYLCSRGLPVKALETSYRELGPDRICVSFLTEPLGLVRFFADPQSVSLDVERGQETLSLRYLFCPSERMPTVEPEPTALRLTWRGYRYRLSVSGRLSPAAREIAVLPDASGRIRLGLCDG